MAKANTQTNPAATYQVGQTVRLDPNDIELRPEIQARYQTGGVVNMEHVEDLAANIEKQGQLQPVGVFRDPKSQKWVGSFGYHRVAAIKLLNERNPDNPRTVWAVVTDANNNKQAFLRSIDENMVRSDLSAMDYATIIRRMIDMDVYKASDIPARLGKSQQWVSYTLGLLKQPKVLQDAMHRGLKPSVALTASKVTDNEADLERALKMAQADAAERLKGRDLEVYGNDPSIIRAEDLETAVKAAVAESTDDKPRIFDFAFDRETGVLKGKVKNVSKLTIRVQGSAKNQLDVRAVIAVPEGIFELNLTPDEHKIANGEIAHLFGENSQGAVTNGTKLQRPAAPKSPDARVPDATTATTPSEGGSVTPAPGPNETPTTTSKADSESAVVQPKRTPRDLIKALEPLAAKHGGGHPVTELVGAITAFFFVDTVTAKDLETRIEALCDYVSEKRSAEMMREWEKSGRVPGSAPTVPTTKKAAK